jgi:hypothetical protein
MVLLLGALLWIWTHPGETLPHDASHKVGFPNSENSPTAPATEGVAVEPTPAIADPDFDGIVNLLEYYLGSIPVGLGVPDTSILPTCFKPETSVVFKFLQTKTAA